MFEAQLTIHDLTERELLVYQIEIEKRRKAPIIVWLLWWALGSFGGHRYYIGSKRLAILMTCTFGGLGFWTLIDAFRIPALLRKDRASVEEAVLGEIQGIRQRQLGDA